MARLGVLRHDLRLEAEQLRVARIDGDANPVRVGPAESLDAREILEQPVGLHALTTRRALLLAFPVPYTRGVLP
jgi:hypothetical protein